MTLTDKMMSKSAAESVEEVNTTAAVPAAAKDESPLFKSVSSFRTISLAMTAFCNRFHALQKHLDSIHHSIDQRYKELHPNPNNQDQPQPRPSPTAFAESLPPDQPHDPRPEIQRLCETMSGRGLRKYVTARLSDVDRLRDDVSQALSHAPDPARLVLDCIGGFYLQGSKAYSKDSPMITARQASILVLEFFLISGCGCSKMEASVKEEVEKAAITWRSRLIREGGIANSSEPDALGLLLFVAAFGIPSDFGSDDDFYSLIRLSNMQKKADVFRRSSLLVDRIKDIIQGMVNNGMSVSAAGLACAFGLKDNLSPLSLLSSYVQEVNQTGKEMRRRQQCSYVSLIEANEKQVASLKLVLRCVVDHKLNYQEVAKWKINKKIAKLERNNEKFEKNKNERNLKRKAGELGFAAQAKTHEKHCQTTMTEASSLRPPPSAIPSQEKILYDGLLYKAMFDGGFPGLLNGFTDASIKSSVALSYGSGMGGLLSRNVLGAFPGPVSGHGAPVGAGPMTDIIRTSGSVGVYAGLGNVLPLDSGRTSTSGRARLYDWHEERAVNDLVGQSLLGMPPVAGQGLMESMAMVKESSVPSHQGSTSSNLYQFADTVLQRESYYGSSHMGDAALVYRPSDV
ncbi:protein FRIGIDA [Cinnamomum micranthum f. kanehirae]|uniref:FRIGIDA-like protein n=1 Tax=Cinnamomum micranthum f. kanehirae TaxID=337451 RepID=A0A443P8Z0_9MAGN|nr:protein FRIGIDA [Cinnamomum micranthum f. kanehirae]